MTAKVPTDISKPNKTMIRNNVFHSKTDKSSQHVNTHVKSF